uniref:Candidate secreted effector n=1 Tax=Meloidogyne incognita TaxID=6306 RepID=A0A914M987_MELIC
MAEEGLTNSDLELKLVNQSNDLIKLQTNFNELQLKFNEEKEKTLNLENELREMKKKNQIIIFLN